MLDVACSVQRGAKEPDLVGSHALLAAQQHAFPDSSRFLHCRRQGSRCQRLWNMLC